ncbi:MAG TPA: thioredoxin domain-containing protein [Burkholderiales bacterium]|nr:thioredoxin domain-containing protein [Burkholderiales bacterium]
MTRPAKSPAPAGKNRLAQETSPYLQQHADNPVDWYPWGEEALTLARELDKPILLSIGYSACHWCHVMAHESFEDEQVAALMNKLFVNIKVDREERPDLDQIYQTAHQLFNQRPGGWPLTMFLTPDQTPFFGGTYFPKTARYGLPGFPQLLEKVVRFYQEKRDEIREQGGQIRAAFKRMSPESAAHHSEFSSMLLDVALDTLKANFDGAHGGFGGAPKFPHATDLEFALRRSSALNDAEARDIACHSLTKMAEGGIYDHLAGGFCRYSVDASWTIPHFEKMLYDNGPLLGLYADAWCVTKSPQFAQVAAQTAEWVIREMQSPEGGYYSSLDADSEGEEGKFYVWSPAQVQALLTDEEYDVASKHWGLDQPANFEHAHWHLRVAQPLEKVAGALNLTIEVAASRLAAARQKLLDAREKRIHPGRDEKVLTSWNALMIQGMAHAARVFGRTDWLDSARRALDFIRGNLWRDERLLATYKDGRAHLNAYLDDYAYLIAALVELLQADYRAEDLEFAETLADVLLEKYEDRRAGGFFFTSHDHESLLHRPKPGHDNAMPAGNGVVARALLALSALTGDRRFFEAAERTLQTFYGGMQDQPSGYATLLMALEERLEPTTMIVLRGSEAEARKWVRELSTEYRPHGLLIAPLGQGLHLPPALAKPEPPAGVNAYVCLGVTCLAPVSSLESLRALLQTGQIQ